MSESRDVGWTQVISDFEGPKVKNSEEGLGDARGRSGTLGMQLRGLA